MATSTVHWLPSGTCVTWDYHPAKFETLQMSPGSQNKLDSHRQSTTLFPMRVTVNHFDSSRGNSKSSLYKSVKNSKNEIHKVNNGAALPVQGYTSFLISEKEKNKNEKTFDRIPQYAKCFTCERIIKEDHFSEHLLFGPAKCFDCNVGYNDCQSFQLWSVERSFGNVPCTHSSNFRFCNNPVQYLIENLSKSENNVEKDKIVSKMKDFIKKCTSLKEKMPWKQAIDMCNDHLKYNQKTSSSLPIEEPNNTDPDKFGIAKRRELNGTYASHYEQQMNDTSKQEDESLGVILSQDFNLKQLEEATEFVEVHENTFHKESHNQKTKRKQVYTQKRQRKQDANVSDEESLEYLPIPSNGFYYVSTKSIEMCPNCSEVLCPSQFSVNVVTFLTTTVCVGCKLTIYITSPEVHILTNDNQRPGSADGSQSFHKKKRGRPKKQL